MSPKPTVPGLALATLLLAGCSTPTAVSTKGAIDAFRNISSSQKDTCQTQREVAEHNSRYDTLKNGKEVVYKAECEKSQRVASSDKPKS